MSRSCNATKEHCMTACKDPKLRAENDEDQCNELCGRCMNKRWKSTDLPGGAFGSQLECFQQFSVDFRPYHIFPENCIKSKNFI